MREAIRATAETNYRSMNAEIVDRLAESLGWHPKRPSFRHGIERAFWDRTMHTITNTESGSGRSPIRGIEIKSLGYSCERQLYGIGVDLHNLPGLVLQPRKGGQAQWVYPSIIEAIAAAAHIAGQFK